MVAKWKGENDVDGKEKDDCIFCLLCANGGIESTKWSQSVRGIGELDGGSSAGSDAVLKQILG